MRRIFVSYSMNDQPDAGEALLKWLETIEEPTEVKDPFVWASSHQDVRGVIREHIADSDEFVVVWSKRAPESPWVAYELGMAHALGRPITVLLAGGDPAAVPADIAEAEFVELAKSSA